MIRCSFPPLKEAIFAAAPSFSPLPLPKNVLWDPVAPLCKWLELELLSGRASLYNPLAVGPGNCLRTACAYYAWVLNLFMNSCDYLIMGEET